MWESEGRSPPMFSGRWDWADPSARIARHGVRNSLMIAPMPTATTSQIMGNSEGIEPYMSNLFKRSTLCGEFTVINKRMVKDLSYVLFVVFLFLFFFLSFSFLVPPPPLGASLDLCMRICRMALTVPHSFFFLIVRDLGLWDEDMKNKILMNDGSVQGIEGIPQDIKDIYKTAYEISSRVLIDTAAERGPFIDQSQSLNLFMGTRTCRG